MKMEKALKYVSGFMRIITRKQVFNDKIAPTCGLKNTNTFFTGTVTAPACVFWWISMFKLKTDSRYISLSLFHSLSETDKKMFSYQDLHFSLSLMWGHIERCRFNTVV